MSVSLQGLFLFGFICGGLGFACGVAATWERRRDRPKFEFVITPEVLYQINSAMVTAWLDERGMVWMPRGPDFKAKVKP